MLAANARQGKDKIVLPGRRYKLTRPGRTRTMALTGDLDVIGGPLSLSHPGKGTREDRRGIELRPRLPRLRQTSPMALSKIIVTGGVLRG